MEREQIHPLAASLYMEIGRLCAGEDSAIDFAHSSASLTGYNPRFRVNVRSHMAEYNRQKKVWHVLSLQDIEDVLENYTCMVSEDGEVKYAEAESIGALTRLDLSKALHRIKLELLASQLKTTKFLPADGQDWSKAELDELDIN